MTYKNKKPLKLYRGIKSSQYQKFNADVDEKVTSAWREIIKLRAAGKFDYPEDMNKTILGLKKLHHLSHQSFTDKKEIAYRYAKENEGLVLEITPSIEDVLKYFTIEFQNFAKRRECFELVYVVNGRDLHKNAEKWRLATREA